MIHFFLYFCNAFFTLGLDEEQTWAKLSLLVWRSDLTTEKNRYSLSDYEQWRLLERGRSRTGVRHNTRKV